MGYDRVLASSSEADQQCSDEQQQSGSQQGPFWHVLQLPAGLHNLSQAEDKHSQHQQHQEEHSRIQQQAAGSSHSNLQLKLHPSEHEQQQQQKEHQQRQLHVTFDDSIQAIPSACSSSAESSATASTWQLCLRRSSIGSGDHFLGHAGGSYAAADAGGGGAVLASGLNSSCSSHWRGSSSGTSHEPAQPEGVTLGEKATAALAAVSCISWYSRNVGHVAQALVINSEVEHWGA